MQKVERGEYVDLRDLLPQKPVMEENPVVELENGIVVLASSKQAKTQKKPIQDLPTWVQAFMAFVAIRNRKYPEATNDLLAYAALIARGAKDYRGQGWLSYDFQFRRLAAARGSSAKWAEKDVSLWNDTVCKPESWPFVAGQVDDKRGIKRPPKGSNDQPGQGPKKAKGKEKPWKNSVCFQYSYAGKCSKAKCDFLHICFDCGGDHAQCACPSKSESR